MSGSVTELWRCGYCLRTAAFCRRRGISPVCDSCRQTLAGKGKKFCRGCGQPKPAGQFDRVGRGGGRRAVCRVCHQTVTRAAKAAYLQRWRQEKRAHFNAYTKAWRARNPERVKRHRQAAYLTRKMRESAKLREGGLK